MAKLTLSQAKSLHDMLGEDLAEFFTTHHGVEGDDDAAETPDDAATKDA